MLNYQRVYVITRCPVTLFSQAEMVPHSDLAPPEPPMGPATPKAPPTPKSGTQREVWLRGTHHRTSIPVAHFLTSFLGGWDSWCLGVPRIPSPFSMVDTCLQLPTMVDVGDVDGCRGCRGWHPYLRDPTMGVLKVCLKIGDSPVDWGYPIFGQKRFLDWPNMSY